MRRPCLARQILKLPLLIQRELSVMLLGNLCVGVSEQQRDGF